MDTLKVTLIGTSPLLMHNPALTLLRGDAGPKSPKARIPSAEDEAELNTYRDGSGNLVLPSLAVRSSLIEAGIGYKVGKRGLKAILMGCLYDVTSPDGNAEWLSLTDENGNRLTNYVIDARRCVVQGQGIIRARPRLEKWQLDADIHYDGEFIGQEALLDCLARAGVFVGLGDFRPQKRGPFGRFRATLRT